MNPTFLRLLAALVFATLVADCIQLPIIGKPTPIASRDIDLAGDCRRTEEDGFREDAQLRVSDNTVQQLSWKLWVGRRGSCTFLSRSRSIWRSSLSTSRSVAAS